jgi:tetratricopeptide (TPR) repeat protein
MENFLIVGALIFIGLAFGSAMIASRKGRSGFGWFLLTLVFPIAILFVAIAAPVSGPTQAGPSSKRDTVTAERDAAIAQAAAGNVLGALTSVEKIGDPHDRTAAFTKIAYDQAEAGDVEGAKKTIAQALATLETIKDSYDRANALRNIAWTQIEAGDVEGAKETIAQALSAAEKIKDATFRKKAFASITKAKARIVQPSQKSPSNLPVDQPISSDSRSTPNRSEPTIPPSGGASEPSESSPAL